MTPERKAYLLGLTQFPQMTANESLIAHQWLMANADNFDDVEFNVRVGNALELGPGFDPAIQRQAALLSQKRIDIVGFLGNTVTIVEVKLRISLSALGQLLGYSLLWQAENPTVAGINLVAIGHDALIDVVEILQAHGIAVFTYPNVALATLNYG